MSEANRQCGSQPDAVSESQTQPKFTLGPYRRASYGNRMFIRVEADTMRGPLAEVFGGDPMLNISDDEAEANGHLFSAALQMYEALRAIAFQTEPITEGHRGALHALLAKAEGK